MGTQLKFESVIHEVDVAWRRKLFAYAREHRGKYLDFAAFINPPEFTREEVFKRLAFAILSVQTPFERGAGAFAKICKLTSSQREDAAKVKRVLGDMIYKETKARGIAEVARGTRENFCQYLRTESPDESWHEYRLRLCEVHGLGKAKASFAASLLYPLEADLACLDTWMIKHFRLPDSMNGKTPWPIYLAIEAKVREYGKAWKVSTFLAQWITWDHERGSMESHSAVALPGSHKD